MTFVLSIKTENLTGSLNFFEGSAESELSDIKKEEEGRVPVLKCIRKSA